MNSHRVKPTSFDTLLDLACQRKGSERNVIELINSAWANPTFDNQDLAKISDDIILSSLCRKIFQAGFVWRVVDAKWSGFEEVFWEFNIDKLILMPDDMLESKARDTRIIRNLKKCWAIRDNALMISQTRQREGKPFAQFIADWPSDDIIGLWDFLKKNGTRLGGNTGAYALRYIGKDSFLLSKDVEVYLREAKIIDTGLHTKSALKNAQAFFNELHHQSHWSYRELSLLVAMSAGENFLQV